MSKLLIGKLFKTYLPATLGVVLMLIGTIWLWRALLPRSPRVVSYSEFVTAMDADRIEEAEIRSDTIAARLRAEGNEPSEAIVAERLPNTDDSALLEELQSRGAVVKAKAERSFFASPYLWAFLPFLVVPIMILLFDKFGNKSGATAKPISFGKSKAKVYDKSKDTLVTFADVAGVEEGKAELTEIVRFLKEPERFRAIGARVPRGVLLVGPPGTGKTLLARAVAGEAGVPFFSMSGSEFVEMFVGVGASRVRDLFGQAKERGPCIIFIDELDAVGKSRAGGGGMVSNEEREQTLNQLLVEMDGFDANTSIIVMGATNRPETLDRALLRAGRFDREVLIDRPDVRGREAILQVHARKVRLGVDVELGVIARRTPGMVGADLANAVNEAALASVRRNGTAVAAADFEEAIDRIQLGLKKHGRVMNEHEKRRVAFHEGGHTLVALTVTHADPVHRVTIIPRSIGALGATLQLPADDRYLLTREELRDQICVLFGGRVAEEVACDDISTGAENDLERATEIARQMVCRFGMSDKLGPLTYGRAGGGRYVSALGEFGESRSFSEETARAIDVEIRAIVDAEHARARGLVMQRRDVLQVIAEQLLAKETLERDELEQIVKGDVAAPSGEFAPDGRALDAVACAKKGA